MLGRGRYAACTGPSEHGHAWTKTLSINSRFGYNRHDTPAELRNATFLLHELLHSASQGGNLDLSVDAMGDGRIDPYHQAVLLDMGGWLRANGEAVYNTTAARKRQNFTTADDASTLFYFTAAGGGDGNPLFAIATSWPGGRFSLPLDGRPCPPAHGVTLLSDLAIRVTPSCGAGAGAGMLQLELGAPPAGGVDGTAAMRHAWAFRIAW